MFCIPFIALFPALIAVFWAPIVAYHRRALAKGKILVATVAMLVAVFGYWPGVDALMRLFHGSEVLWAFLLLCVYLLCSRERWDDRLGALGTTGTRAARVSD